MAKLSSSTRAAELAENYEYCGRLLREKDRDLWLASLFAPQEARKGLHALYAFENEIAGVREKVTQPLLGEMRLQWWSDLLESPAEGASAQDTHAHPVADALLDAIERCGLPRAELLDLIEAHVLDLYDDAMESVEELEYYCDRTVVRLMRLAGRILSGEDKREPEPFRGAGAALGMTQVLRSLPKHTAGGQMFVPRSVLAEFGASETDLRNGVATPQILAALKFLRGFARAKYSAARERANDAGSQRAALLPAALVPIYLDAMERADYEPFQPTAGPAQWRKQWRLWRASRRDGL